MTALLLVFALLTGHADLTPRQADSVQRSRISELYNAGKTEDMLEACRDLVSYHKEQGNQRELFNAYATLLDRLQVEGRFDEAMSVLQEMSADAVGNDLGTAVTEFCFGQFYLGNKQPAEAKAHYLRAFRMLKAQGDYNRAIRCGFNLQAVAMNLNTLEDALAINDSTQMILMQMERANGKRQNVTRFKQSRYRFVIMQRLGRMEEAAMLKDSVFYYHGLLGDSSQDELLLTSVAQYEQAVGNKEKAYACLDTLIQRNFRIGNYLKVAQFRKSLADYQVDNGDLDQAVASYRLYASESDSAQVHRINDQLNVLTKQFNLQKLELENTFARKQNSILFSLSCILTVLLISLLLSVLNLRRKNKVLYQASLSNIQKEEENEQALVIESSTKELSQDERLYAQLLSLMHQEELFKDPDLTRDILATRLGTNRTYLADAVRNCAGQTLRNFVNHYRLRWAAETLSLKEEISVSDVGEEAGFASRSTFYRLFQLQYGMSPNAFRKASRE